MSQPAIRALASLSGLLAACRPAAHEATDERTTPPPPVAGDPAPPDRCRPTLPAPPATYAAGAAYVLVDRVGVLRIAGDDVTKVLPAQPDSSSFFTELVTAPNGELWLSDWDGVVALEPGGAVRDVRRARGGPLYQHLQVRSPTDAWAVTSDIEWTVVHYDGKTWTPVRRRDQFPGRFDDNKFAALAATADGIWVSSWNGLWRGVGDSWQQVEPPTGDSSELWVHRDRVIAGGPSGHFIRTGSGWTDLRWPLDASTRRAVHDIGLVASPGNRSTALTLGAIDGAGCTATADAIQGSTISDLTIDGSGRVWVATDRALAVLDGSGRLLSEWTAGTLPGLTGKLVRVAVAGAGPERLPAPRPAPSWNLVGRLVLYKNDRPLANAALELCSSPGPGDRCEPGAFTRTATTGADGSFRLADVPPGDFSLIVRPPAGLADCETPFTDSGHFVAPARDCPANPGPSRVCDLGVLTDCLPFEMPPPH